MKIALLFCFAFVSAAAQTVVVPVPAALPKDTATAPPEAREMHRMHEQLMDWPALARYRADNASLLPVAPGEQRVVFLGDSITDAWGRTAGSFFPGRPYVNRGISGQTTPQMLVRFQQDVVHLHPAAVVILAGTNDIAGNTGPSTPQMMEDNYIAMAAIAKQAGIKLVLASITPAFDYPWNPAIHPVEVIRELNAWMRAYCASSGCIYLDYYTAMADEKGAMLPGLSYDGVHPTAKGYALMSPLAEQALARALAP